MILDGKVPSGPLDAKWDRHKFAMKLVNPANRRKHTVIVVGTGLAGGLGGRLAGRAGLQRHQLQHSRQPAPRAQHRRPGRHQRGEELPERRRQRLPAVLRHHQGRRLPLPRRQRLPAGPGQRRTSSTSAWPRACPSRASTAALLDNRSFGGAQVSRTFYARGQTGQQLLLGAYSALMRQVDSGQVKMFPRREMLDLVVDRRPGPRHRRPQPGHRRDRTLRRPTRCVLCTGGYGNVFYLSTNAGNCNVTAAWRGYQARRLLRQPLLHADPSHLHPGQPATTSPSSR